MRVAVTATEARDLVLKVDGIF